MSVWFTALLSFLCVLLVLAAPVPGLILVLVMLYFAVFPTFDLGPVSTSITTLPMLALAFIALVYMSQHPKLHNLRGWQYFWLIALALAFVFPTTVSFLPEISLPLLPNLLLYVVILFAVMALVRRPEQLVTIGKAILVILVVQVIWKYQLAPLRAIFGLPSLVGNALIFNFHPAFALCLVILLAPSLPGFTRRWHTLAWVGLAAIELWTFWLEARAGLIAQAAMFLVALLAFPARRSVFFLGLFAALIFAMAVLFPEQIQRGLDQTIGTLQAVETESIDELSMSSDDLARMVARNAAMDMYRQRPFTGWGPNTYVALKTEFAIAPSTKYIIGREGGALGAFNSWLMVLAEMGVFSTLVMAAIYLLPLPIAWRQVRANKTSPAARLAFAYALGLAGLAVHLYFIDLIYGTFEWLFVALAWAAVRIAADNPEGSEAPVDEAPSPPYFVDNRGKLPLRRF